MSPYLKLEHMHTCPPTSALVILRVAADEDWTVGMVQYVVTDAPEDGATQLAHPACPHDDGVGILLLGNQADVLPRLLIIHDDLKFNLKKISARITHKFHHTPQAFKFRFCILMFMCAQLWHAKLQHEN